MHKISLSLFDQLTLPVNYAQVASAPLNADINLSANFMNASFVIEMTFHDPLQLKIIVFLDLYYQIFK